jgi:hypothetical protein
MALLTYSHELALDSPRGPVVAISFRGAYPAGSQGNGHAAAMRDYIAGVVAEGAPAAVLFDLTGLQYTWGDGICSLAIPLRVGQQTFIPFCLVASEPTATKLAPLLGPSFLLGLAGGRLFPTRPEGLSYLAARLAAGGT